MRKSFRNLLMQESWGRESEPKVTLELPLVTLWARPDASFNRPKVQSLSCTLNIRDS